MFTDLLNNTIPLIQSGMRWALEALANSLWQGVALTIALAIVLHFGPRLRASSRYALWYVALFAVVSLPILGMQKVAGEYALNLYENVQSFASQNSDTFSAQTAETEAQPEASITFASSNSKMSSSESIRSEATTTSASGVVPADASISSASLATTTQPERSTTTTESRNPRITKTSSEPVVSIGATNQSTASLERAPLR